MSLPLPLLFSFGSLFLIIILLIANFKDIKKQFSGIKRTTWLFLLIIFIFGFFILEITPTFFFTVHDENFFVRHARDISQGNFYVLDKSVGYPLLMGILFFFVGANYDTAYSINLVLGSLSIILIFFVSYLFFRKEDVGLYSSVLLSLFIPHMLTSRGLESNTSSVFALLLALVCFLLYFKIGNFKSQLLAAASLSFATLFRLEFVLLPFLFAFMVIIFDRNLRKNVRIYKWWVPWILVIVFTAPWIILVTGVALLPPLENPYIHDEMMIYEVFGLDTMTKHIPFMEGFFINSEFFPLYMITFLFLGPLSLVWKEKRKLIFLLTMFTVFTLLPLSFAIPQDRYFLVSYMVMIIFWAKGISFLSNYIQNTIERKRVFNIEISFITFLIILVLIFASFLPYFVVLQEDSLKLQTPTGHIWSSRELYLQREAFYYLNKNLSECDIIVVDDEAVVFENLSPTRIEDALNNPGIVDKSDGCLLYFEDLYCEAPIAFYPGMDELAERYKGLCSQMHEKFDLTVYRRFEISLPGVFDNFTPRVIQDYSWNFTLYNVSSKLS